MAEGVLTDIAVNIFNTLSSSLIQKVASSWYAEEEFRRLRKNIEDIKPVLADAERRQHGSEAVKKWLASLQDVIYDAEDLVDEISSEAKRQELMLITKNKIEKRVRVFFSCSSNPLLFRLRLFGRVKEIRERLDDLKSTMVGFNFLVRDAKEEVILKEREETVSFVREDDIIGRDGDRKALIDILLKANESQGNPSVLSIVGIGGLGKTALAQLVYNDSIVQQTFEPKNWVCVTEDFNVKEIARKFGFDDSKELGYDSFLRKYENKRYLIVLDDVWNEKHEKWLKLKAILPSGASGSAIIVTTRSKTVANIMGSTLQMYELQGLTPGQSWTLFKKVTEQPELESNLQLKHIGEQILKKCANVPLAIRTLGSLLCGKDAVEWSFINDHELANIEQDDQDILPVLRLSYNHLPSHLKNCFAFCAVFPKDYIMEKWALLYLWTAAGFLQPTHANQRSADVGEIALMFLLRRCFFQDVQDIHGQIISFKMHDLIHDLAQLESGKQAACIRLVNPMFPQVEAIRYLHIDDWVETPTIPSKMRRAKKLRVLTRLDCFYDAKSTLNAVCSSFQFIRVLNLSGMDLKKLPSSIARLKLLRFINLSYNDRLKYLPNSLISLVNLQILILYNCPSLERLPRGFNKLISLQKLNIAGCLTLTIMLTKLKALDFLLHCPFRLTRIQDHVPYVNMAYPLTISGHMEDGPLLDVTMDNRAIYRFKKELASLELWDVKNADEIPEGFPSYVSKLSKVIFAHFESDAKDLPKFAHFPSLKILILQHTYRAQYIDWWNNASSSAETEEPFFPYLEELEITDWPRLKAWSPQVEAAMENNGQARHLLPSFPRLSVLSITDCPNLKFMPLIPHLTSLHLKGVNEMLSQTLTEEVAKKQLG